MAEEALRHSETLLNEVGQIAKIGGWELDLITGEAKWPKGAYDIVEIDQDQPIPDTDEYVGFHLLEYRPLVEEAMKALIEGNQPLDFEAQLRTAKGNVKWCRALGRATKREGKNIKVRGTFQDISERKKLESELQAFAETQAVLLREVNHRVKNNLMVVISMLHKEKDRAEEKEAIHSLPLINDLLGRIEGLSIVHSMLSSVGWQPLVLSQLCEQIIKEVFKSHKTDIELNISPSNVRVDSDQAHHLTLVINELATNSLKYALPVTSRARIAVDIKESEDEISILFSDNGPGFPEEIISGEYSGSSIGLGLINGIVKISLNGSISFRNEGGAYALMTFANVIRHKHGGSP